MKRFFLIFCFFALVFISFVSSRAQADGKARVNEVILVDDFDDETIANVLGGETGSDEVFPGSCDVHFWSARGYCLGNRGSSLRVDYNTALPNAFVFYYQRLGEPESWGSHASYPLDLSDYGYLSFWIMTDIEKPRFCVELHQDSDGDHLFILGKDITSKLVATRYIVGKDITRWRKVVIPLAYFRAIKDWSQIIEIDILFEDRIHSGAGTVFFDDVVFGKNLPPRLRADASSVPSAEVSGPTLSDLASASSYFKGKDSPIEFLLYDKPAKDNFYLRSCIPLEFHMEQIPPELECLRFEIKRLGYSDWETLASFYEHSNGVYKTSWRPEESNEPISFELRVAGYDQEGYPTVLTGPYKSKRYDKFFV